MIFARITPLHCKLATVRPPLPSPPLVSFNINPLKNLKSAESTGQLFSLFPLKEDHGEKWRREKVEEKEENTKGQSGINK